MAGAHSHYRPLIGRVTGLGSAKDGTHHWWMQRLTAIALVPLTLWFAASIVSRIGADHAAMQAWLAQPVPALLMLLFLFAGFYHLKLGLQVVIEDYVHTEWSKMTLLVLNTFGCIVVGAAAMLSVLALFLRVGG